MAKIKRSKIKRRVKLNNPVDLDSTLKKANKSLQEGNLSEAEKLAKSIIKHIPSNAGANHILGVIHLHGNSPQKALKYLKQALETEPSNAWIYNNIGVAYKKMGQLDLAASNLHQALQIDAEHLEALNNLGTVFLDQGENDAAKARFEKVLTLRPEHLGAHVNLAALLDKAGEGSAAVEHYLIALKLDPNSHAAKNGLARYFADNDDNENAAKLFEAALIEAPGDAVIHANYAIALRELAKYESAVKHFKIAIEIDPNYIDAKINYASLLNQIGDYDLALELSKWVVQHDPLNEKGNSNLLFGINYHPTLTAEEIFAFYQEWEARVVKTRIKPSQQAFSNTCKKRRLKIGYVSPDFYAHVVRFFIESILENHNRDQFEIYAYAELSKLDFVSLRAKRLSDHWIETKHLSDDELEARIREDEIDILVDLAGHTTGNRLMVFARRPAPIQLTWMGYGYTTGLTAIDYFLGDQYFTPEGYDHLFSEKVYRLPRISGAYRPPSGTPEVAPPPVLRNGYITFGSLCRTIRLNDRVIALWAKILAEVPGSVLILDNKPFAEEETQQLFKKRFAQHGISENRLIFSFSRPHWPVYHEIDISLDPFPCNGGTSNLESIWMGVPVVTLAGRPSVGRGGSVCLHAVEMTEWIAYNEQEYVEIAVAASQDIQRLAEIRQYLRQRLQDSPFMDDIGFIRELEEAYLTMWSKWCDEGKEKATKTTKSTHRKKKKKSLPAGLGRQNKKLNVKKQIQAGLDLHQKGQLDEAEAIYQKVLKQVPLNFDANNLLGAAALQKGDYLTAERFIRIALSIDPNNSGAHNNLGTVLKESGKEAEAFEEYKLAVALDPNNAEIHNNIGSLLRCQGKYAEAIDSLKQALALDPNYADALYNIGIVSVKIKQHQLAADFFKQAVSKNPNDVEAYYNLGEMTMHTGDIDQAISYYEKALQINPLHKNANSNLLFAINYHPHLAASEIFKAYQEWEHRFVQSQNIPITPLNPNKETNRPLRIGYVSPDFREHVVRFFLEPVLEKHNHENYKIFAYAELENKDHVTLRAKRLFDHWRETKDLNDDEMAAQIREDKIDILVDLAGHTSGNRLMVFARKPAPIQVSWMGYGYTTGLTAIDYFLADKHFVPVGYDDLFSEQVYRLPRVSGCYRPPHNTPEVVPTPALGNGYITFGSLCRSIRLNERVISLWAKILLAVPKSVLILDNSSFAEKEAQQLFQQKFAQHGIGAERLVFAYSQPHWPVFQQIDISLDPFPCNGGTSNLESLWMGAPVITLADRPSVGRGGSVCLNNVAMTDWIATTESEYLKIAVEAAQDFLELNALRQGLRKRMQNSEFMDEAGFMQALEEAYRTMWHNWCANHNL